MYAKEYNLDWYVMKRSGRTFCDWILKYANYVNTNLFVIKFSLRTQHIHIHKNPQSFNWSFVIVYRKNSIQPFSLLSPLSILSPLIKRKFEVSPPLYEAPTLLSPLSIICNFIITVCLTFSMKREIIIAI